MTGQPFAELVERHGSVLALPEAEMIRPPAVVLDRAYVRIGTVALWLVRVSTEYTSHVDTIAVLDVAVAELRRIRRTVTYRGRR